MAGQADTKVTQLTNGRGPHKTSNMHNLPLSMQKLLKPHLSILLSKGPSISSHNLNDFINRKGLILQQITGLLQRTNEVIDLSALRELAVKGKGRVTGD